MGRAKCALAGTHGPGGRGDGRVVVHSQRTAVTVCEVLHLATFRVPAPPLAVRCRPLSGDSAHIDSCARRPAPSVRSSRANHSLRPQAARDLRTGEAGGGPGGEAASPIPWAHANPSAARCLHKCALRVRCGGRYASFRLCGKPQIRALSGRCAPKRALPSPWQAALCFRSSPPTQGASRGLQDHRAHRIARRASPATEGQAAAIQRDQLYRSALDEKARRPSSFVAEISSSLVNLAIGRAP